MRAMLLSAALAVTPLLATLPATADDPLTPTDPSQGYAALFPVEDETLIVQQFGLAVDQVEDLDIYSSDGENIGDVEDILVDAEGRAVGISTDTRDLLQPGDHTVVLPLEQIALVGDNLVVNMTAAQIEALPEWDD